MEAAAEQTRTSAQRVLGQAATGANLRIQPEPSTALEKNETRPSDVACSPFGEDTTPMARGGCRRFTVPFGALKSITTPLRTTAFPYPSGRARRTAGVVREWEERRLWQLRCMGRHPPHSEAIRSHQPPRGGHVRLRASTRMRIPGRDRDRALRFPGCVGGRGLQQTERSGAHRAW